MFTSFKPQNQVRPVVQGFPHSGAGIHWLRYTAAALRKISHASGPDGIRTHVDLKYLTHAKISIVNAWMISPHIRFKAIYLRSNAFSHL